MRNRDLWLVAAVLVVFAATAHAAPKIEVQGPDAGVCLAQRGEDDTKLIQLTIELDTSGRPTWIDPPRRITDATVAAINATLRACRWQPAPAPRKMPVRVWVPSDSLF